MQRPAHSHGVNRIVLDAGGLSLSALMAEPAGEPQAVLVALHGAGMTSGYFDGQAHPGQSLLTLGASLGCTVLALDRPGYGLSAGRLPGGQGLADQALALRAALADFSSRCAVGAGIVLLGHSFGGKLALTAAARGVHERLLGLDISGSGHRYAVSPRQVPPSATHRLHWGPLRLYPPGTFTASASVVAPVPLRERTELEQWPQSFPSVAARVRVPVRLTFAEHEAWWRHDDEAVAELSASFAAPRLVVDRLPGAGHNISLGRAARTYHLRVLAFVEECLSADALPVGAGAPSTAVA
ncbi:alpha/beta hydrolase [Streptomyces sp. NPDC090112]|uniref:alpha/beta hydrolase n=1 Tax=Streptomyces sp. NPDC090112 TaxID=3365949 RepID=UPI00382AB4F0